MTSVRLLRCPECDSTSVDSVPLEEKNQHYMNVNASLTCKKCDHTWEGRVSNPARKGTWGGLGTGIRRPKRDVRVEVVKLPSPKKG